MKDRFKRIDEDEAINIFDNAEWILKKDHKYKDNDDDGASMFLESAYSPKQRFGYTDYIDHRNDNLETIKKLILKDRDNSGQRLHFYKDKECNQPFTKVVCWGYYGGITAEFSD